jgi:hypothetical protein
MTMGSNDGHAYFGVDDDWKFVGYMSDDGLTFRPGRAAEHDWSFVQWDLGASAGKPPEYVDILRLCQRCGFSDDVRQVLLHPRDASDAMVADWSARMLTVTVNSAAQPGHALLLGVVPTLAPCRP